MRQKYKRIAERSRDKRADIGPDIDVEPYIRKLEEIRKEDDYTSISSLEDFPKEYEESMKKAGIDTKERCISGSFLQRDHAVLLSTIKQDGLEVMSSEEAVKKYDLEDYWWRAVPPDMDKYTAWTELEQTHGYFIRSMPGKKIKFPVQSCLLITRDEIAQNVHNVIIAEEDSELHIITG